MGYTHYWIRPALLDQSVFLEVVRDFKHVLPKLEQLGVLLGDELGRGGGPVVWKDRLVFNGRSACGHEDGFQLDTNHFLPAKRTCEGALGCCYETFSFHQDTGELEKDGDRNGRFFHFCKTAYKPYDFAVIVALIIVKHHFGQEVQVRSDGGTAYWADGMRFCQRHLGYGVDFCLDDANQRTKENVKTM